MENGQNSSAIRSNLLTQGEEKCGAPSLPSEQSVDQNIEIAEAARTDAYRRIGSMNMMMGGSSAAYSIRLEFLYGQVKNKGPWDYKQQGNHYEAAGNFNYGAVGAALGIPDSLLLRGAGWAQQRAGTSGSQFGMPFGRAPYGDDPIDQAWIQKGIDYYKQCRK